MSITYVFALLGGLAVFLFGMDLMSSGLEMLAGKKLHNIIEKLTSSTGRGILVGVVVTAIMQSSSATTVMTVGFVNAGLMTLKQAVGVIMGANIGTTVTGQLVALNITSAAPLMAFGGFLLFKFFSRHSVKHLGQVILGLGLLFMGMHTMSSAMSPLRDSPVFISWMVTLSNPLLGILVGTAVTAIIQSSSASLGILQALANKGLIGLRSSMFIICGFNIGTCITSILSAMGSSVNGKRTAMVHVLFNLLGTLVFLVIATVLPIESYIVAISKDLPAAQIANMHTLFNIGTTILLFPFSNLLANMATSLITGEDQEKEDLSLVYINRKNLGEPPILLTDIRAESRRMIDIARENFQMAINLFDKYDREVHNQILYNETIINYLNSNITKYIIDVISTPMDESLAAYFTGYLRIVRDIERIGDHVKSIAEYAEQLYDRDLSFTVEAKREVAVLNSYLEELYSTLEENPKREQRNVIMRAINDSVEKDVEQFRESHLERMKSGVCDPESGLVYEKMLINYERISAYLRNIGKLAL